MPGGTTEGQGPVPQGAGAPHGVPGGDALNSGRVAAAGPALRSRVPGASGAGAPRGHTAAGPPVPRGPALAAPDAGRATVRPAPLSANRGAPGGPGAPVRQGPALLPALRPRGEALARPGSVGRRRPRATSRGRRPPTRSPPTRCARRRATVPPGAQDGTARRLVRPQAPPAPTAWESGQTQAHPLQHGLCGTALRGLRWRSDTPGGRGQARRRAGGGAGSGRPGVPTPPGSEPDADADATRCGAAPGAATDHPGTQPAAAAARAGAQPWPARPYGHRPAPPVAGWRP